MNTRFLHGMALLCCVLCATSVLAQNPTGTVTGRVSYENEALPGVTVTASSPAMQGSKTAITGSGGDYTFKFLPPGDYKVTFALDSFRTLEYDVKVSIAQTKTVDAVMYPEAVTEEIVVTSNYETISSGSEAAITYEQDLIEDLPIARNLNAAVLMTPGTANTGPSNNVVIAGAQSYESLFLVNGVVVNENLRGQALDLFIEDAIEETTTTVSGISAEYGRFAGGVVNMITKSGGNEFSGSYRLNLTNDDWEASTPLTTEKNDKVNKVHEATLGGYVMKDKLWFFLAGRDYARSELDEFYPGAEPSTYNYQREQQRYEAKLTFSPHASHRFMGSYIDISFDASDRGRGIPVEPQALDHSRSEPQELMAINYTGVLSDRFFLEAQHSQRKFSFVGSGGDAEPGDRINGTYVTNYYYSAVAGSYLFCGQCGDETRDNENQLIKGSYFLASENLGTHDIVFGYDTFADQRFSNNYQSPSNFKIYLYTPPAFDENGQYYPIVDGYVEMDYWPMLVASTGNEFSTDSAFVNDTWRVNNKLTISGGLRWDANDGVDGSGNTVVEDSRISPRLGMSYDVKGDGEWLISASFGRYVTAIANSVAGEAGGGNPSWVGYEYQGPSINAGDGPYLDTREALAIMFAWFDSVGGLSNTDLWYSSPTLRGINLGIGDNLASPYGDEISVGVTKRLSNKGLVRADYVHREYGDFYVQKRDMTTGTVNFTGELAPGAEVSQDFDYGLNVNDPNDVIRREYDGLHTMFQYRLNDKLSFGGNWTWSHTRGNFNGETAGAGPITSGYLNYPEYAMEEWDHPTGDLAIDQRHKVRAFAVWDAISTPQHNLTVSLLQNFWTGTPYGAQGLAQIGGSFVDNPGYVDPPLYTWNFWFANRDAFRTDDITRTDISLNYSFFANLFGTELEVFVQPEVLNVFDEHGIADSAWINTNVDTSFGSFDPYTETPVQGTGDELAAGLADWALDPDFGQATNEDAYQIPRTFRVSLGFRF